MQHFTKRVIAMLHYTVFGVTLLLVILPLGTTFSRETLQPTDQLCPPTGSVFVRILQIEIGTVTELKYGTLR